MKIIDKIHAIFNNATMRKFWLKIRKPVVFLVLLLIFPLVRQDMFWIGLAISLFGEAIQLWCFASLNKSRELACSGPYACVRNPMYLGRFFIVLGLLFLLGNLGLWIILPYTILYWFYMRNRVAREEAFLAGKLGDNYATYCKEVNRFVPSFKGIAPGTFAYWNWKLLKQNNGWINAAALLVAFTVLYFVPDLLNFVAGLLK